MVDSEGAKGQGCDTLTRLKYEPKQGRGRVDQS